eukprot:4614972-Pyramimonas_sp.AAC.1
MGPCRKTGNDDTDGCSRQTKEKQKADQEAVIAPRKIPKVAEEGMDDCCDDLKGFGSSAYYTD